MSLSADARAIVEEQLRRNVTITSIAETIGYSRTAVSLYLAGTYPSKSAQRIEAAILNAYCDRVVCPHLGCDIAADDCRSFRERPLPQSDAIELRHWLSCQRCALNPAFRDEEKAHA